MFGKNEVVGKKYFKDADGKYLVTSVFYTLQGEGPFSGQPAVFIRLAKCNLACSFCDTYFDSGTWMTPEEIRDLATKRIAEFYTSDLPKWILHSPPIIVFTGGEPLLQDLTPLVEVLAEADTFKEFQVETNGLLVPKDFDYRITLVCSPKCAEVEGIATKYLTPKKELLERANYLKFVMCADQDSPYSEIPDWAHEWLFKARWREDNDKQIYISPMNIYTRPPKKSGGDIDKRSYVDEVISFWEPGLLDMEANRKNHEYAARYCMKHGLRLNLQVHLYASLA